MMIVDPGAEIGRARLGDPRLSLRAEQMARALVEQPGVSLPRAMGNTAAREAAYRFLGNRRVTLRRVMEPHIEATVERARQAGTVLVVSDTTEFRFSTEREGLGVLSGQSRDGFIGHFTMVVSADGRRTPLGVVGLQTYVRPARKGKRDSAARKRDPRRESLRWRRGVEDASQRLDGVEAVHVMDREADIYELMSALVSHGHRFIIRSGQERLVDEGRLTTTVACAPMRFSREVKLSARTVAPRSGPRRTHPVRRSRLAQLAVSTAQITLRKPRTATEPGLRDSVYVNVVRVWETDPPADQEPVEWRLFTSEPVDTQQQVEQIVDGYRTRWVIEEYFKALKTGCNFESSQLESRRTLENLLGIYVAVAWQLLVLRSTSRDEPDRPATDALTRTQLAVLRLIVRAKPIPPDPTIADVARAIAELGGHIKSNGPPGWQVLGRGFEDLRRAESLYTRIISATSNDQ